MLTPEQVTQLRTKAGLAPESVSTSTNAIIEKRKQALAPKRGFMGEILPVGGSIVGGIGGGILGGLAGGPIGAYGGAIAGSAAGGALGETAQEAIEKKQGTRESFSGKEIGKTALQQGALEAVGGLIGPALKGIGKVGYKAAIPTTAKEAKLLQNYKAEVPLWKRIFEIGEKKAPTTGADTSFKFGLKGTESMVGVQATRAQKSLWKDFIGPQLDKSKVTVNMPKFFEEAKAKIISQNPELSRQNDLLNALKSLSEDYKGVKDIPLKDLQKFKEGWAKFVSERAYRGKPIAGSFNEVKDLVSDIARTKIYDSLGKEVQQAYFDYGNLKGLQELGQKAMVGKVKGGTFTGLGAIKDMALTPIGTIGGKTLYRVGQLGDFVGAPGLKTMSDLLGITGGIGESTSGASQ